MSPSAYNNNQRNPNTTPQKTTVTMKANAGCNLMGQANTMVITSATPQDQIPEGATYTLSATVTPHEWVDAHGRPFEETNLTNNTASVTMQRQRPVYGYQQGMGNFAPLTQNATLEQAYPNRNSNEPIVARQNADAWANVTNGNIGLNAQLTGEAIYIFEEPTLNNLTAYQFWDPKKQVLDVANLSGAVLGEVAPSVSRAETEPALRSRAMPADSYTKLCTTAFDGTNIDAAETMQWSDCNALDPNAISGIRFLREGAYSGGNFGRDYPKTDLMFSQVPFKAIADPGTVLTTQSRWMAQEWEGKNRNRSSNVTVAGNVVLLDKAVTQGQTSVEPEGTINYQLTPQVSQAAGTFLPNPVTNLKLVDTLDAGIMDVNLSGLDPFWKVEILPADLGPDGLAYTSDDVRGMQLVFTPDGEISTDTPLPVITYTATMGIVLPPQGVPYFATVKDSAVLSADHTAKEATAVTSLSASTPEASFFRKFLTSEPVIEVRDEPVSWRVEWVNYNNYNLGQAQFVDVFPYNGDGKEGDDRYSNFAGQLDLNKIVLSGSAKVAGVKVELTTDAPGTIGESPALKTTWKEVSIDSPEAWPTNPTAIRLTLPSIPSSTQGYGSMDLVFKASGHQAGNRFDNNASARVYDPKSGVSDAMPGEISLGTRQADHVTVVASSIGGVAWIDANKNGIRDDGEELLKGVPVKLFQGENEVTSTETNDLGAYLFDVLHSSDPVKLVDGSDGAQGAYTVQFDVPWLDERGYKVTEQIVGTNTMVDPDADQQTGKIAALSLGAATDERNLDIGVVLDPPPTTTSEEPTTTITVEPTEPTSTSSVEPTESTESTEPSPTSTTSETSEPLPPTPPTPPTTATSTPTVPPLPVVPVVPVPIPVPAPDSGQSSVPASPSSTLSAQTTTPPASPAKRVLANTGVSPELLWLAPGAGALTIVGATLILRRAQR